MASRKPEDRRVVFSITMRSENTTALNAAFQRLMDTIAIYHSPRRRTKPALQQQQQQQQQQQERQETNGASTAPIEQDHPQETDGQDGQAADDSDSSSPPPPLAPAEQNTTRRLIRDPHVTLGGIRGPIRLPKAGRMHTRRIYLIQASERALRHIAAQSALPLCDQVGQVATSQELDGAVEIMFELE
ncbi:hypothetical protein BGZ73_005891 [Actinomortierella ambigua]|nr:hypothetical protein BGZ73_005891 [Actinomortierella ambigua]